MSITRLKTAQRLQTVRAKKTPVQLGFCMQAEWEAHEATWLAWPHNRTDWPGKLTAIHWVYSEMARQLFPGETVRILDNSKPHEIRARRLLNRVGVDPRKVEFFLIPTNRGWTRDCGPIFLKREGSRPEVAIARFRFNAWARYSNWNKDDQVPFRVSEALGYRLFPIQNKGRDVVLDHPCSN